MNRLLRDENKPLLPSSKILLLLKIHYPQVNLNWIFSNQGLPIITEQDDQTEEIIKLKKEIDRKDEIIGNLAATIRNIKA